MATVPPHGCQTPSARPPCCCATYQAGRIRRGAGARRPGPCCGGCGDSRLLRPASPTPPPTRRDDAEAVMLLEPLCIRNRRAIEVPWRRGLALSKSQKSTMRVHFSWPSEKRRVPNAVAEHLTLLHVIVGACPEPVGLPRRVARSR